MSPLGMKLVSGVALREPSADSKTHCQIAGKEIAGTTCEVTQGQEGCFGCASPLRLCETCRVRRVAVPAVGMCSTCLQAALTEERTRTRPTLPATMRVTCQFVKREIRVPMCEATQGQEGCFNCPAPSRTCELCQANAVRFPRYGLCLACSVSEYGDGWQPHDGAEELVIASPSEPPVESREVAHPDREESAVAAPMLTLPLPLRELKRVYRLILRQGTASVRFLEQEIPASRESAQAILTFFEMCGYLSTVTERGSRRVLVMEKEDVMRQLEAFANGDVRPLGMCRLCEKPVEVKKHQLCWLHAQRYYRQEQRKRLVPRSPAGLTAEQLLPKARELVLVTGRASLNLLCQELGVGMTMARKLLPLLEQEGTVGPFRPFQSRNVLRQGSIPAPTPHPVSVDVPISSEAKRIHQLIASIGEDSDIGKILQSLLADAEELQRLKRILRNLAK